MLLAEGQVDPSSGDLREDLVPLQLACDDDLGRLVVVGRKGDRRTERQGRVIPYGPGSRRCSCKSKMV